MLYNREQILQLAPDEASARAGQQLATRSKWVVVYANRKALWGDCQGSGKTPYKTIVDLTNLAFKCTCPSRKFPCKHGLGLLLLYAQDPGAFHDEAALPEHVAEWLGKREVRDAAREQKSDRQPDDAARVKRVEARERKVDSGIAELRAWLRDVIRNGLMHVPQQAYQFNANITARMIDAQAGGLAAQLRQVNLLNFFTDGWQKPLLKRLSGLYMLTEGYLRRDQLPPELAHELRTLVGWTTSREEVLEGAAIADHWIVLSVTSTEEGNLTTERIWLFGRNSARFALLLNFYAGNQVPQHMLFPGMHLQAELAFYPGANPVRALIRQQQTLPPKGININTTSYLPDIYTRITETLAANVFTEQVPFILNDAKLIVKDEHWFLVDPEGNAAPVSNDEDERWTVLAFSTGQPFSVFGVYENETFGLHYVWTRFKGLFVK
ncbi:SWIM zinc finger family protein [Dyadobacter sp. 676]|uniref:SWIM zinc finger family protein n=1 Tax=Dyadobacter sp. 676 TaxID=3088362 RepID=A0AAU8FI26_9BACT